MNEPTATTYRPAHGATLSRVQVEIYPDDDQLGERFMVSDTGMHFDMDADLDRGGAEERAMKRANYYVDLGHEVTMVRPAVDQE
jgi:hypothetical protein